VCTGSGRKILDEDTVRDKIFHLFYGGLFDKFIFLPSFRLTFLISVRFDVYTLQVALLALRGLSRFARAMPTAQFIEAGVRGPGDCSWYHG
jgi:hypothetical protein